MHGMANDSINYPVLLQLTYQEALDRNENECKHWQKLKEEYSSLQHLLKELPNELSKDVMVPVAPRALMRGKIIHTNEILVCLGQGYFVKRSGAQAAAICTRREKICSDMLQSLEKERELFVGRQEVPLQQEAFGGGREILEVHSEEEEAHWQVEHKQKEREYRQKLAELKTKEKTAVTDEESLWQRLDELELQEELEEELLRLHADDDEEDVEEEEEEEDEEDNEKEDKEMNEKPVETGGGHQNGETQMISLTPSSRRVSFAGMEADTESGEDLRITFQHSKQLPIHTKSESTEVKSIESPAELYEHFRSQFLVEPRSILKKTSSYDNNIGIAVRSESPNGTEIEADVEYSSPTFQPPPVLEEVVERNIAMNNLLPLIDRPVSRFKALRQQKKR